MANIPIKPWELPAATPVAAASIVGGNGAVVQKYTPAQIVDVAAPLASQEDAESGTGNSNRMSALRVKQAIDAQIKDGLTDEEGAGLVGYSPSNTYDVDTVGHALSDVKRSLGPVNMPRELAFKKSIAAAIPYHNPDSTWIIGTVGASMYPQGFTVDEEFDELFVITNDPQVVSVYELSTGAYKTCFALTDGTTTSEGVVVINEGGSRTLYARGASSFIRGYDITTLPAPRSTLTAISTTSVISNRNFSYRNGIWMLGDETPENGRIRMRNKFVFYDDGFNWVGQTRVSSMLAGLHSDAPYTGVTPKMQGLALTDTGFIFSMGGYQSRVNPLSLYGLQGLIAFGPDGTTEFSALMDPLKAMDYLESSGQFNGVIERMENEGVVVTDEGNIYSLYIFNNIGAESESIVIFREFSDDKDALDFSSCALNWQTPDIATPEYGIFPRFNGGMLNPFTGHPFASWNEIVDYMVSSGQSVFSYYSSSVSSVVDINGGAVPSGWLVTFRSANNITVIVHMVRGGFAGAPEMYYVITANTTPMTQTLRRGPQVVTSISEAPQHVGQMAVVSGVGYMATGTSTTADWKQVTA